MVATVSIMMVVLFADKPRIKLTVLPALSHALFVVADQVSTQLPGACRGLRVLLENVKSVITIIDACDLTGHGSHDAA